MDLQKLAEVLEKAGHDQRSNYHVTLGAMIEELKAIRADVPVIYSHGGYPCAPHSYRGYYSDLAFETQRDPVSAGDLLAMCVGALGAEFTGWKGGEYVMHEKTPLWAVVEAGCCGPAIVAVANVDGNCVLVTKEIDD